MLIREIRVCGSIYLRWMYPVERYIKTLKGYMKNLHYLEALIVERYITKETICQNCKLIRDVNLVTMYKV
jgi:hypothetical protein